MSLREIRRILTRIMPRLRSRAAGVGADVTDIPEEQECGCGAGSGGSEVIVSKRAYELWIERGCPEGSPEEDWFRAESELKEQRGSAGTSTARA